MLTVVSWGCSAVVAVAVLGRTSVLSYSLALLRLELRFQHEFVLAELPVLSAVVVWR